MAFDAPEAAAAYGPDTAEEAARHELYRLADEIRTAERMYQDRLRMYDDQYRNNAGTRTSAWSGKSVAIVLLLALAGVLNVIYHNLKKKKKTSATDHTKVVRRRRLQHLSGRRLLENDDSDSEPCAKGFVSGGGNVNLTPAQQAKEPTVGSGNNRVILSKTTVQDIRRRWKREQATMRFRKVPAFSGSIHSSEQEKELAEVKPQPEDAGAGGSSSSRRRQVLAPAPKNKQKTKIKLPEPERFLPKIPSPTKSNEEAQMMICQPVNQTAEPQAAPAAGTSTSEQADQIEQRFQVALLSILAMARAGQQRKMSKEEEEATVHKDGMTHFLHVPYLPSADHSSFLLKRLAKEFLPIIKRRGYNVLLVSE